MTRTEKLAYLKEYRDTHKESIAEVKKRWYQQNIEREREKRREHYRQNKESYIKRAAINSKKDPDKTRLHKKKWNENNRDYFNKWKLNNKDKIDAWYANNKDKVKMYRHRRRALLNGRPSDNYTKQQIIDLYDGICQLCLGLVDKTVRPNHPNAPSVDHIIPVSKGGDNTFQNIQLAHYGCNSRKGNR